jgi:hypothetical protein
MKKILFILGFLAFVSCTTAYNDGTMIVTKFDVRSSKNNSCIYYVETFPADKDIRFIDRCGAFHVGDTVKIVKY